MIDLDDFDRRLIDLVRRNNLEPARSLADKVGLSISAVLRRLRQLRDEQVIIADVAVINPALTGSAITMHVLVRMHQASRQIMDDFARHIVREREVTEAWEITGEDDFLLKVQVDSMAEYDAFIRRELADEEGVAAFKTFITIRSLIEDDAPIRALTGR